jgi:mono/diheme cytochrome c family protein
MRVTILALAAAAAAIGGCAGGPVPVPAPGASAARAQVADMRVVRGHAFAGQRCAGCHTIGLDDGGAGDAPPFRTLSMRYNAIALEHRFAEISAHGYDRMPAIALTPGEAEDLIAYLDSLHAN